jgi:4-hydroxy-tetrahydrodipicolinate reductase
MIKLCVAGATGKMGSTLIKDAYTKGFEIVGAVAALEDPEQNKTLREVGLCNSEVKVVPPSQLSNAVKEADVYASFATPEAEVSNLPLVAKLGKRIIMGTTGLTEEQMDKVYSAVSGKVPAVFAPNFALGVNLLFKLVEACRLLPPDYNFSIIEAHHVEKRDAPSGTAKRLGKTVSEMRGYTKIVQGREGVSPRSSDELEMFSIRGGGITGIHEVIIAGPHEMIRIEHTAFSRSVFSQGVLYAAEWLMHQREPKIYTMDDVFR